MSPNNGYEGEKSGGDAGKAIETGGRYEEAVDQACWYVEEARLSGACLKTGGLPVGTLRDAAVHHESRSQQRDWPILLSALFGYSRFSDSSQTSCLPILFFCFFSFFLFFSASLPRT